MVIAMPFLSGGCNSEPTEFDQAANYTAESLAQELTHRYRALSPTAQTSNVKSRGKKSGTASASKGKPSKKSVTRTTKKAGPATIDDVLDDIEYKMTLVKGSSPAETTKKMSAAISSDSSLPEADKKTLTEYIGRLAN